MATFDDVARIGLELPEVTVGTWYGTPGLHVRKKGFCRMWDDRTYTREGVDPADGEILVVMCDVEEKAALIDQFPDVLLSTPHYDGHGAMLVRLAVVTDDDLADFLEDSYRLKAPATLLKQLTDRAG
jgi:hypothetical protein